MLRFDASLHACPLPPGTTLLKSPSPSHFPAPTHLRRQDLARNWRTR